MYTIGEISKIVNISTNALRYYDEIGLLKPSLIQNDNQYRYYSEVQIKDIIFIQELKQYGFKLYEIKELLHNNDKQKLKLRLEEKHTKLNIEISRLKDNSILLEKRIFEIIKEDELKMKNKKILIVDDLALARVIIKSIVEEHGYAVVGEASNGEGAVIAYERLKPDLVIMDIVMPVMDGIDAAREIIKRFKNARIIMCTAMSEIPIVVESIKTGAKDFIAKPISSIRLINAIIRSFDDSYKHNIEKINYISQRIAKYEKKEVYNRSLKQESIDDFINEIVDENAKDEFIDNFMEQIRCNCIDMHSVSSPSSIEEKDIIFLKSKLCKISRELAYYLSDKLSKDCIIKLLTAENITVDEFKTFIDKGCSAAIFKYESFVHPVFINIYDQIKNEQEVLKEVLKFISAGCRLKNFNTDDARIILGSDIFNALSENYSIILVSFSIEFAEGEKGFAAISIPHEVLQYMLL